LSNGDAGDLLVIASEFIELIGTAPGEQFGSALRAVSGVEGEITDATGKGGDLIIETRQLIIRDGAEVTVSSANPSSDAQGAGNLEITAQTISLDNQATLTAQTASGDGGNITLQVQDTLLLRRNGNISTTAGTAQAGGDGGNIAIDTDFIVAIPLEDSNITANAFIGSGGNVQITAQGIFGIEFREEETPLLSEITASSKFGVNGVVTINTPDVDPSQGLVNLPDEPANVEVAEGCQSAGEQVAIEFFNTGRGGLAPSPYEPLSRTEIWEDVPRSTQEAENLVPPTSASIPATRTDKIVEAQGWLINETGKVALVAEVPTPRSQHRCRLH
jgi:large exoprotein involved in heme utilization and adhesion